MRVSDVWELDPIDQNYLVLPLMAVLVGDFLPKGEA